jgi:chromosomal replication initiation ATPase DnaA
LRRSISACLDASNEQRPTGICQGEFLRNNCAQRASNSSADTAQNIQIPSLFRLTRRGGRRNFWPSESARLRHAFGESWEEAAATDGRKQAGSFMHVRSRTSL